MIIEVVHEKLQQMLRKKQHEVIQLRWQKAQMEKNLENLKRKKSERQ